jgi:O-antigen/teichoic acid export membrane protein
MFVVAQKFKRKCTPEQVFMGSAFFVNVGNYFYNLLLGRYLGPSQFADAAILITLLLVLSFIAMTFQFTVIKFTVEFPLEQRNLLLIRFYKYAIGTGLVLGMITMFFSDDLMSIFQTESSGMFIAFGLAIPLYFIMSVNRGILQGKNNFISLSITYQAEMLCRFFFTFTLLILFDVSSDYAVSIAIGISFLAGLFPMKTGLAARYDAIEISKKQQKTIVVFFFLTACYELTQIVCNNSDILLVKHYFPSYHAGLYASLALIGRAVYFVTWMFVMLLLPRVLQNRKEGKDPIPVLKKYIGYIIFLSFVLVSFTFIFPEIAVHLLFGTLYISISSLLGWYALATSFFALANIFAYYFLCLDQYIPIAITAFFGTLQVALIILFHDSLLEVVMVQVYVMAGLLVGQIAYFSYNQLFVKNE